MSAGRGEGRERGGGGARGGRSRKITTRGEGGKGRGER